MQIAKEFLKSFTIHNPDTICPCGAFCHGSGSNNARVWLNYDTLGSSTFSFVTAVETYGVDAINESLAQVGAPCRLERVWSSENKYSAGRMLKSDALRKKDDVSLVTPSTEAYKVMYGIHHPIAVGVTACIGEIETVYETETRWEQIGTGTEEYDEPIYEDVTKYKNETYEDTKDEWGWVTETSTRKKTTTTYVYNSWSKKTEPRTHDEYFPHSESHLRLKKVKVNKTRQVPYTERVRTGTRKASREVPLYGYVDRDIPHEYCNPTVTEYRLYLLPLIADGCKQCRCVACRTLYNVPRGSFVQKWCEYFKDKSIQACLVCGKSHDTHDRFTSEALFVPYSQCNTHEGLCKSIPKKEKELYDCFAFYSGKRGRCHSEPIYDFHRHACTCFQCIRTDSNSLIGRWIASDVTLDDKGFKLLRNRMGEGFATFFLDSQKKQMNAVVTAAVQRSYVKTVRAVLIDGCVQSVWHQQSQSFL